MLFSLDSVSTEQKKLLELYVKLLLKWNKSINLISKTTESTIWQRHIEDSLQLLNFIPSNNLTIIDLGSGAGIPSIIMAIINTNNQYTLVESNNKKCVFMLEVKNNLQLNNITIVNSRIENIINNNVKYNIVVSRGLTSLLKLTEYADYLLEDSGCAIFPKGEEYSTELEEAKKQYDNKFNFELYDSKTNIKSKIIKAIRSSV